MVYTNYICKECRHQFEKPNIYIERHGLDAEPYERVAVCPKCKSCDYVEFDAFVEKIEVAEQLLNIVFMLNRHKNSLINTNGVGIKNNNLYSGIEALCEYITDMYEILSEKIKKRIFKLNDQKEVEYILSYLKGEM